MRWQSSFWVSPGCLPPGADGLGERAVSSGSFREATIASLPPAQTLPQLP